MVMRRTNTFAVRPLSDTGEQLLRDLLDASAALWNEVNYERLMRYNDEDGFEGDVWDADTGRLEGRYKGVLGASTAQQVIRKNSEAWRAFFVTKDEYLDILTRVNAGESHGTEPLDWDIRVCSPPPLSGVGILGRGHEGRLLAVPTSRYSYLHPNWVQTRSYFCC